MFGEKRTDAIPCAVVALLAQPLQVVWVHTHAPDMCHRVRRHHAVAIPTLVVVEVGRVQGPVANLALSHQDINLTAR